MTPHMVFLLTHPLVTLSHSFFVNSSSSLQPLDAGGSPALFSFLSILTSLMTSSSGETLFKYHMSANDSAHPKQNSWCPSPNLLHPQPSQAQLMITATCLLLELTYLASSLTPIFIAYLTANLSENLLALLLKSKGSTYFSPLHSYHLGVSHHPLSLRLLQILLTEFPACAPAL